MLRPGCALPLRGVGAVRKFMVCLGCDSTQFCIRMPQSSVMSWGCYMMAEPWISAFRWRWASREPKVQAKL